MDNDRGSALLTTVVSVVVLALIAAVFFSLSASRAKMESSEERGLRAYYLAESGIQYGISYILQSTEIPTEDVTETRNNPFGPEYGGSFTVDMSIAGNTILIESEGHYQNTVRKLEARLLIREE